MSCFYESSRTRSYTYEYYRLPAKAFKKLLNKELGKYEIHLPSLNINHVVFTLKENDGGERYMELMVYDKPHKIALKLDNRSASNKLYITCPYCQKQRESLFIVNKTYVCRECIGLHYASQSEKPQSRLMRRIRKLRTELWGSDFPEINNMFKNVMYWPKPKWMRWKTFEQKRDKITELENKYWPMAAAQMKITVGSKKINT